MKNYAVIDANNNVSEIVTTDSPEESMIECNKPIYIKGYRYFGNIPKVGYNWDGEKFEK